MKELLEFGEWDAKTKKSYRAAMANGRGHQHELLLLVSRAGVYRKRARTFSGKKKRPYHAYG